MKAPSPAFSLYPKDILSDENCVVMTHEEFGAYMRLLMHCWLEGSIPADHVRLARILGATHRTFKRIWPAMENCFYREGERLLQKRLEKERQQQDERRVLQSAKGIKSAKSRAANKTVQPGLNRTVAGLKSGSTEIQPSVSVSVSDSVPVSNNRQRTNGLRPAVADVWSRRACELWTERFKGTAPGGRIGKALKPLVTSHGWPAVETAWRAYLDQSEAEYASAERFAQTYGRWSSGVATPTKRSVAQENAAVVEEWGREVLEGKR